MVVLLYSRSVSLTNAARCVISQFPVMDILCYCTYMPFWTLFLPSKLIWHLSVSAGWTGQQENQGAFFVWYSSLHIYTEAAHTTVYHTLLNNWFTVGIKALFIEILLLSSFFFAASGLGDLHALTVTVKCLSGHVTAPHKR